MKGQGHRLARAKQVQSPKRIERSIAHGVFGEIIGRQWEFRRHHGYVAHRNRVLG